jgi:sulfate adenylyltransferase subunit 2
MATLTHLDRLEAESIDILREAVAESERPVLLYSIGKDSSVLLHLARKAFHPSPPPFPLLHVDTTWKFREMIAFRDRIAARLGLELIVHRNPECLALGINPFDHGSARHTDMWKTQGLRQALDKHRFDVAIGGARRDEERSRAKERVFSFRTAQHRWDPRNQRPELWRLYNGRHHRGEHIRVFPLSNWTELDIWQYILEEGIELPPIYYAHRRMVFQRDGMLLAHTRFVTLLPGDEPFEALVRFRTVGDATCTGCVESTATTPEAVVAEVATTRVTERGATRADDRISEAGMEDRKKEGYF